MSENEIKEGKEVALTPQSGTALFVQTNNKTIQTFQIKCSESLMNCFNNKEDVKRFISTMMMCFSRNPKLNDCTQESIMNAFLQCAEYQLFPTLGQCYVIPYFNGKTQKSEAQFQIGYSGIITLAARDGIDIDAQLVYEKDEFSCTLGTEPSVKHVANVMSPERGNIIGTYAIVRLPNGKYKVEALPVNEILKHRQWSQSWLADQKYKSENSPWQDKNDPHKFMFKKTLIKQIFKQIPKEFLSSKTKQAIDDIVKSDSIKEITPITILSDPAIAHQDNGVTEQQAIELFNFGKSCGLTRDEIKDISKEVTGNNELTTLEGISEADAQAISEHFQTIVAQREENESTAPTEREVPKEEKTQGKATTSKAPNSKLLKEVVALIHQKGVHIDKSPYDLTEQECLDLKVSLSEM